LRKQRLGDVAVSHPIGLEVFESLEELSTLEFVAYAVPDKVRAPFASMSFVAPVEFAQYCQLMYTFP